MEEKVNKNYNAADLDPDIVVLYLWKGLRTPQNEYEKELLKEIKEMEKKGIGIELPFN